MNREDIDRLLKLHRGRVAPVLDRILKQDHLGKDDHLFLEEHLPSIIESPVTAGMPVTRFGLEWLRHIALAEASAPVVSAGVSARLCQAIIHELDVLHSEQSEASFEFAARYHVLPYASEVDPDAWTEIVGFLLPRLRGTIRDEFASSVRGNCAAYNELAKQACAKADSTVPAQCDFRFDSHAVWRGSLAAELFEFRNDEPGLKRALLTLINTTDDEGRAYLLSSVEQAGLLAWLTPDVSAFPARVQFFFEPGEPSDRQAWLGHWFRQFALRWPDTGAGREWIIDQVFHAAERGVPWGWLFWESWSFRERIARKAFEQGIPVPWALGVLVAAAERGDPTAWRMVVEQIPHHVGVNGIDVVNEVM